jgi:peptidylprolyl isomerase
MKASIPLIVLCAVIALVGCGGSSGSTGSTDASRKTKPDVSVPKGPPPKKLVIKEIEKGTGETAKKGDEVTVQWVGVMYKSGKEYGTSWRDDKPFTFETNAGRVIPGWDRGVLGMKVGGRRELFIPPPLAYEDVGTISIPPNETLVLVMDLLAVKATSTRSAAPGA